MDFSKILKNNIEKGKQRAKEIAAKEEKAISEENKSSKKKVPKFTVPGVASNKLDNIIKKAADKHTKKKVKKKEKAKQKKPENREPVFRITFDFIITVYEKLGISPIRAHYWYAYPLLRRDWVNDERTKATPLGALCLLRRAELNQDENAKEYQKRHSAFIDEPSHTWVVGSVNQLLSTAYTGLTCSYLLGFKAGFDGNKKWPTFHMMGVAYTRGFEDGSAILEKMLEKGLVEKKGSLDDEEDSYRDEQDQNVLNELYRVRGYEREGFRPYTKEKTFKPRKALRKEKLKQVFKNGEIRD